MLNKFIEPVLVLLGLAHFKFKSSQYCYKSDKDVRTDQFRKLKKLLCIAYDEIPYYQEKYRKAGFNPHYDFSCLADMVKIPILDKKEARENQKNLINKKRVKYALDFKTSGSTGHPFLAKISPRHWIVEQSCIWRHWSWAGYRFRNRMAIVRSHVPKNENDLIKWDRLRNFIYFSPFNLSDENIQFYLKKMLDYKVSFLRGYPSSILAIADFVARNPQVKAPFFKGIFTASERLGGEQKAFIEKSLQAKVFNHYGLAEQVVMFGGCEEGSHLHNYEEYGFLELIDTDNSSLKSILGTNLNNYAMPLIRYQTGDLAQVSSDSCKCSRTSPTIKNVVGREDAVISMQDGSSVPVTNFYTMFEYYSEYFSAWQIVQTSPCELCFIVDIFDDSRRMELELKLREDIELRIQGRMKIIFNFEGQFIQVGEGKRNPFYRLSHD